MDQSILEKTADMWNSWQLVERTLFFNDFFFFSKLFLFWGGLNFLLTVTKSSEQTMYFSQCIIHNRLRILFYMSLSVTTVTKPLSLFNFHLTLLSHFLSPRMMPKIWAGKKFWNEPEFFNTLAVLQSNVVWYCQKTQLFNLNIVHRDNAGPC